MSSFSSWERQCFLTCPLPLELAGSLLGVGCTSSTVGHDPHGSLDAQVLGLLLYVWADVHTEPVVRVDGPVLRPSVWASHGAAGRTRHPQLLTGSLETPAWDLQNIFESDDRFILQYEKSVVTNHQRNAALSLPICEWHPNFEPFEAWRERGFACAVFTSCRTVTYTLDLCRAWNVEYNPLPHVSNVVKCHCCRYCIPPGLLRSCLLQETTSLAHGVAGSCQHNGPNQNPLTSLAAQMIM